MRKVLAGGQDAADVGRLLPVCGVEFAFRHGDGHGLVAVFVEVVDAALDSGLLADGQVASAETGAVAYAHAFAVCRVYGLFGRVVACVYHIAPAWCGGLCCCGQLFDMRHGGAVVF